MPFLSEQTSKVIAIVFILTLTVTVLIISGPLLFFEARAWIYYHFTDGQLITAATAGFAALTTWLYS